MQTVLALALVTVFVMLSLVHVYWALGGRTGHALAVPQIDSRPLFSPSPLATLAVAAALAVAALVVAGLVGWLGVAMPALMFRLLTLAMALVFLLRAIGDFTYIGFFRRASASRFAYWDLRLYSPLCLFIAAAAMMLVWSQR
jgi:hypothetical protein